MKADVSAFAEAAPPPTPVRASSRLRPKYILFAFIGLMYAYVLWNNESFLINHADPEWMHLEPFKWLLLPHGLAAGCTLITR